MRPSSVEDEGGLPPPGQRWGAGAQSVLPFLTRTLQAKPSEAPDGRDRSPREQAADVDHAGDAPQARHYRR